MTLKQKEVLICDNCHNEIKGKAYSIETDHGGYSEVVHGKKRFTIFNDDFCSLECFFIKVLKRMGS